MFGDDYKKAIDKIQPDGYVKQKVLKKLDITAEPIKKVKKFNLFKAAAAVAVCCSLLISVWSVISNRQQDAIDITEGVSSAIVSQKIESEEEAVAKNEEEKPPKKTPKKQSYLEIYNAVKKVYSDGGDEYVLYSIGKAEVMGDGVTVNKNKGSAGESVDEEVKAPTATKPTTDAQSETVNQVEGVHEADIVKTDGKYIYCLWSNKGLLKIVKAGENPKFVGSLSVEKEKFNYNSNMYLADNRLILLGSYYDDSNKTRAIIYSLDNPEKPKKLYECAQSGYYKDSRLIGDKLYLISNYNLYGNKVNSQKPETYVPVVDCKNYDGALQADSIFINSSATQLNYTVICGFSVKDGTMKGAQSFFGGTYTVYCSKNNIITAGYSYNDVTEVTRCSINDGEIKLEATGEIEGELLNQFSIDEYNGYFRFVTTERKLVETKSKTENGSAVVSADLITTNALIVLRGDLTKKSAIKNLAPDERVYSVRFMGDTAYFVTFRETDPLFSVDLSDPAKPRVLGALKIPGFSDYLFPFGEGKLLGVGKGDKGDSTSTEYVKLSMFDISNPANVRETAKAVMDDRFSEALETHKATFINSKNGLIGFGVYDDIKGARYMIYKFAGGKFVKKAEIDVSGNNHSYYPSTRGLYIDGDLYIYAGENIFVYDLSAFTVKKVISIK